MQNSAARNFNLNHYLPKSGKVGKVLNMEDRYRTCCNCWHIRVGTVILGVIELVAVSLILVSIIRQLRWKTIEQAICSKKSWSDCLNFRNINLTMTGDYIITIVLSSIIFCILLMFYGVLTCKPRLLLPHLIVQGVGLLLSFGYFILYAWTYFHGDLYVERKEFVVEQCIERMWLSAIILVFAIFQCYLFCSVVKCSLYLNKLKLEQQRRFMQFEEVSNRVKLAKENGLWRSTSWGGSFQQYRGQYERKPKKPEEKKNICNRVQWDLDKNVEKAISCVMDSSFSTAAAEENDYPKLKVENNESSRKLKNEDDRCEQQKSQKRLVSTSSRDSNNSSISRGSTRMSRSSKTRRSRESESSNNSSHPQHNAENRPSNSNGDSPPTPSKQNAKDVGVPNSMSASAVIYARLGLQAQKPLPQAIVRLKCTHNLDNVEKEIDKHDAVAVERQQEDSFRESRRHRNHRPDQVGDHHQIKSTKNQTAIPQVKKISIASKAIQP